MRRPYEIEHQAYRHFVAGKRIPPWHFVVLILKSLLALLEMSLRYIPGGFGYKLRYYYYKLFLKRIGKNVLIDAGVFLNGPRNISLGDYVWIDTNCRIDAMLGEVTIGKRVHIAPSCIIFAREPVTIGDYVGISAFTRIYSSSETPVRGKRVSGPMVPEEMRSVKVSPIEIGKDAFVGTGAVILPGANLGEGAVVGANVVVRKPVPAWKILAGIPARIVGSRQPVNVPDI